MEKSSKYRNPLYITFATIMRSYHARPYLIHYQGNTVAYLQQMACS